MISRLVAALVFALALPAAGWAQAGLVSLPSPHGVAATVERLEAAVKARGAVVVARVDHAAAAAAAGQVLRPTVVVIFGNPRLGTPLMQSAQSAGLDLPMRMLVWQDAAGKAWVSYAPPAELGARHGIKDRDDVLKTMAGALSAIAAEAVKP
jgi:uncharacterized protein (DUF302 family)